MKKYIIESARCTESCGKEYAQKPLQVLLAWQINSCCDMFDNETLLETNNYDEAVEFLKTQYSDVDVAATGTGYQIDYNIVELAEVAGRYDEDGDWEETDYTTLAYAPVYPSEPIYTVDMIKHDDEEDLINSFKSAGCRIDNETPDFTKSKGRK